MMAPKWWLDLGVERRKNGRLWHVQADVSTTRDHVSGRLRCSFRVGRAAQTRSFASRPAKIASCGTAKMALSRHAAGLELA